MNLFVLLCRVLMMMFEEGGYAKSQKDYLAINVILVFSGEVVRIDLTNQLNSSPTYNLNLVATGYWRWLAG